MIQRPRYAPVHSAAKAENVPAGRSLPIEAVEGVGSTYGGRLREANVGTTNDLIVLGLVRGEQTIGEFWNQWLVEHTPLDPDKIAEAMRAGTRGTGDESDEFSPTSRPWHESSTETLWTSWSISAFLSARRCACV